MRWDERGRKITARSRREVCQSRNQAFSNSRHKADFSRPKRLSPGKRIASVTMEHIREAVVGAGLASDEEISGIVAEINSFADDPQTILSLPKIFQVWGKKPD